MATSKRPIVPRNFFLNEFHELSPVEKLGGGLAANYLGVSWAAKSKQIHDSLDDVADKISSSHDPLKDARYFVLAQPVAEVEKASKDKKKAPGGSFKEKTAYGGIHGRVFDRLGLDLLQVTDDGSAIVHAESEKFDQLRQRSASLDRLGSREQARWVTIESFSTVPLELRVDADWLRLLKPDESSDVIIELQPVLTVHGGRYGPPPLPISLLKVARGEKLTGTGTDFSGPALVSWQGNTTRGAKVGQGFLLCAVDPFASLFNCRRQERAQRLDDRLRHPLHRASDPRCRASMCRGHRSRHPGGPCQVKALSPRPVYAARRSSAADRRSRVLCRVARCVW